MGKRKRTKRVFPIRYASDFINVYQGPNRAKLAEYHNTVRSTKGPRHNAEPIRNNTFTQKVPKTKGKTAPLHDDHVPDKEKIGWDTSEQHTQLVPKVAVQNKLREIRTMEEVWHGLTKQGVDQFHGVTLVNVPGFEVKKWFCGNRFFFTRRNGLVVERSVVYPARVLAETAWERHRVQWDEVFIIKSAD